MTQHEHLPPAGYVQAREVVTHGDRIEPGVETIALADGDYPTIVRALNWIREDSGGPSWPPESNPLVAARWEPYLAEIEASLASLSDKEPAPEDTEGLLRVETGEGSYLDCELYVFCNGEATVMELMCDRGPPYRMASHFLSDFFEGWGWYPDEGFDPSKRPPE